MPAALALILGLLALLSLGEAAYVVSLRLSLRSLGRINARNQAASSRGTTSHSGYEAERAWDTRRRHP